MPAADIPDRVGQAVEALETVPILARAIERAGVEAPVTSALARLIEGTLPVDDWVALVQGQAARPGAVRPAEHLVVARARLVRETSADGD